MESYEPSAFGYTKNNDDVHYENFKLSVQFPLLPKRSEEWFGDQNKVYFSFTGLFAFYIGDRPSGPVVGQEYNPQLFFKHLWSCKDGGTAKYTMKPYYGGSSDRNAAQEVATGEPTDHSDPTAKKNLNCYVTIGYNHDSNGQRINSLDQFLLTARQQGSAAAYDSISRGWDYIGITSKFIPYWSEDNKITVYPMFKYFLADGLLQGNPEELHNWEHPGDGKPRRDVDGLSVLAKYQRRVASFDAKVAIGYTTGYEDTFHYNTVRLEAGVVVMELPLVVWAQKGYMSDLSRYYQNVTGFGLQIEIGAF